MVKSSLIIDALAYRKYKSFGYQEYLFNLLNYFYENRNEIKFNKIVVVCDTTQVGDFDLYKSKFTIIGYKTSTHLKRFIVQFFLHSLLKLSTVDLILSTGNYSSPIKYCKRVLVIHDLLYLRKSFLPNFVMRLQRNMLVPRSVKISERVIAISNFTKDDIVENITSANDKKIEMIYNYFNFSKFSTNEQPTFQVCSTPYFLCVSSSAFHKNLISIFKAYKLYCKGNNEKNLIVVGNLIAGEAFDYYSKLPSYVKEKILIYKNISNIELSLLYKHADAYISATLFEGLGMPIVEAMFFEIPLIISDIQVLHEITQNHANFFDPLNFNDLSKLMIHFSTDILPKRKVVEIFSETNTSKRYITLLNQFCE